MSYAMDFSQIGSNILSALKGRGLTQQSLAEALNISKQVMNKIVKGTKAINVAEIAKIADVLGTTVDALLSMPREAAVPQNDISFMGIADDQETQKSVTLLRSAIDEIHMLEDLLNDV